MIVELEAAEQLLEIEDCIARDSPVRAARFVEQGRSEILTVFEEHRMLRLDEADGGAHTENTKTAFVDGCAGNSPFDFVSGGELSFWGARCALAQDRAHGSVRLAKALSRRIRW